MSEIELQAAQLWFKIMGAEMTICPESVTLRDKHGEHTLVLPRNASLGATLNDVKAKLTDLFILEGVRRHARHS